MISIHYEKNIAQLFKQLRSYDDVNLGQWKVSRLRLYKMRVLKYYVENKAQLETWK